MKKFFLLTMVCLMALTMHAQKIAVLDLQLGTNVTEEETEYISYEFRENFLRSLPERYKEIDKDEMNKVIEKYGYDKTGMTRQQLREIGRKLVAKYMVVGTLSKGMEVYSIDVHVIDVSTGTTVDTEGGNFTKTEYRYAVKCIAARLASRM